jgi:predicted ester cyclase/ketosteroid isomerase-like protein
MDNVILANDLFDAAEAGDAKKFLSLCTADASVLDTTHKSDTPIGQAAEFVAKLPGMFKEFKYAQRRYTATADGAVLQHTLTGQTADGAPVALPIIIRMYVAGGKVRRLEEYYDGKRAPFAPDTPLKKFLKEMNKAEGHPDAINQLISPDLKSGNLTPMYTNRDGFWKVIHVLATSFTNFSQIDTHYVEQGNMVVRRIVASATHSGQFMGIPATGKKFTYEGFEMIKIVDGKIVEDWILVDILSLLQQIGATPETMKLGPKFGVI